MPDRRFVILNRHGSVHVDGPGQEMRQGWEGQVPGGTGGWMSMDQSVICHVVGPVSYQCTIPDPPSSPCILILSPVLIAGTRPRGSECPATASPSRAMADASKDGTPPDPRSGPRAAPSIIISLASSPGPHRAGPGTRDDPRGRQYTEDHDRIPADEVARGRTGPCARGVRDPGSPQ